MKNAIMKLLAALLVGAVVFTTVSCGGGQAEVKELLGAGASFPKHFYLEAFKAYEEEFGVRVNYQPIGSSGGKKQLDQKLVNFGASDKFLDDESVANLGGVGDVLHIPTCIGAIAVAYNLEGNPKLKLTGDVIAKMFMKKITKWNDPAIAKLNPGVSLPDQKIVLVGRAEGSGTTYNFTLFLTKVSSAFKSAVGAQKSPKWELDLRGKGNDGIANYVKETPGAVGYLELAYVERAGLAAADVQNAAGKFITPTLETASLCGQIDMPDDTRVVIANSDAENGYPISTFTWIIFYQKQETTAKSMAEAKATMKLLWWLVHEGQEHTGTGYATLPGAAVEKAEKIIKSATFNGQPVKF